MSQFITIFLTILLGIFCGTLGGGLGLGVTTLALPGFSILKLVPNIKTAIGTTLVSSPASWPAVYKYYKSGNVNLVLGVIYFITYLLFSYFGASISEKFSEKLSEKVLNYSISAVHIFTGLYFFHVA